MKVTVRELPRADDAHVIESLIVEMMNPPQPKPGLYVVGPLVVREEEMARVRSWLRAYALGKGISLPYDETRPSVGRPCSTAMKKPSVPWEAGVSCKVSSLPSAEHGGSLERRARQTSG